MSIEKQGKGCPNAQASQIVQIWEGSKILIFTKRTFLPRISRSQWSNFIVTKWKYRGTKNEIRHQRLQDISLQNRDDELIKLPTKI
uniref:Phosphoinositide phosphatase SAC8-like n=1 Tax=Rhizophora mucronata TaxID=61149 RepID=A0A2P2LJ55_RHIMU